MKRNLFAAPLQLTAPVALAQLHSPADNNAARLKEASASATRTERPPDDVPSTVTVIAADAAQRKQPLNSVNPLKFVTGQRYDAPGKRWRARQALARPVGR